MSNFTGISSKCVSIAWLLFTYKCKGGGLTLEQFILLFEILLINMVLSGDNAIVIAMASKNLPKHDQKRAIWWGAFGAVALRCILTVAAMFLLKIPLIQATGALMLLYISIKLLMDEQDYSHIRETNSLWKAIQTIMIADFVMSLDNVLAIAAVARGNFLMILIGIALSIPIVIWGSNLMMHLLHRYPVLIYLGSGILGLTAGKMLLEDKKLGEWLFEHLPIGLLTIIPFIMAVLVIVIGMGLKYQAARRH